MTKEKFAYELIENWLYFISQECVLMENYVQKDKTETYQECCDKLGMCFDYYDKMYEEADLKLHSEEEIDARLEYLIQKLRNETIKNITSEIETKLCTGIEDKKQFMDQYLFLDEDGKKQDITKRALIRFVKELRLQEERR